MSKVKIQGNASGTGTLTLTAPNTNSDRTITLPDSTGNILMSDGDGSSLTGIETVTKSTTAPSSPSAGDMWFNTSTSTVSGIASKCMGAYSGTEWLQMSNKFSATGGSISIVGDYTVHTFTSSGTFIPSTSGVVDCFIVAGGGGGGCNMGGGGGAGGVLEYSNVPLYAATTITIGNGGAGAPVGHGTSLASNGGNSSAFGYTAIGGGRGGSWTLSDNSSGARGASGGSGGGESGYLNSGGSNASGTAGQGYEGGKCTGQYYSGGGGGGSERGRNGNEGQEGGDGVTNSWLGISHGFAGGGGGSGYSVGGGDGGFGGGGGGAVGSPAGAGGLGYNNGSAGTDGCTVCWGNVPGGNAGANTGGGGGGGAHNYQNNKGGNGGSGIVIVRYLT